VKTSDIHLRTAVQYFDRYMSERKVYERVERFKGGRTSIVFMCVLSGHRPSRVELQELIDQRNRTVEESVRMKLHLKWPTWKE
jgi:hypothetical protein